MSGTLVVLVECEGRTYRCQPVMGPVDGLFLCGYCRRHVVQPKRELSCEHCGARVVQIQEATR